MALEASERESIRAHLSSGCPTCTAALAEAEATLAKIPLSLRMEQPSPQVRDRLMQRVLATKSAGASRSTRLDAGHPWRTMIALAACLVLGFGATYYFVRPTYEKQIAAHDARIAQLNTQAVVNQQMVDMLGARTCSWSRSISSNHSPKPGAASSGITIATSGTSAYST